ncbi:MAG TPA: hypothetical protein DEB65_08920 [Staphylococcus sp.]|uniref:substrate-binding domain-containing protein n=1 Tax=Mammaliicoccus lentus TaxID=42858 RepID=UPI000CD32BF5|nr:substrate-binding domain-containing protein [Mammaliicoccus lentus]POA03746.1 hypothetical protein CD135_09895 [Mammaliicoccus lentus]SUM50674.1 transcriptional regulator [Mammaliicoccus lentus]HBV04380.1 hypothetical protein [Staphylococcus sp.]
MALDHEMNKLNLSLKNISRVDSNFSVNILKEKENSITPQSWMEGWTIEAGMLAMKYILESGQSTEVVLTANDMIAIGAGQAIKSSEIKVPEQLQIIGINNNEMSSLVSPSISSIDIPKTTLAKEAVRLTNKHIKGNDTNAYHININTDYIKRESTQF